MTIQCASTFSSDSKISHYAVFALYEGSSIISTGMSAKNCNYGSYGIFYSFHVQIISDTFSTYENNTSEAGGIYYISGDTTQNK